MTHSPAPFTYDNSVGMIFDANGRRVADLNPNEYEPRRNVPLKREMKANANLFLSAPDMLAALQAVVAAGSWHDDGSYVIYTATDFVDDEGAIGIASAAIAKANGGTAPAPAVTVAELLEALKLAEGLVRIGINTDAYERALRPGYAKKHHDTIMAMIAKAEGRA